MATHAASSKYRRPSPEVLPPRETFLQSLDAGDRRLLEALLSEVPDCIAQERFLHPETEDLLFGQPAGPLTARSSTGLPKLSPTQERLFFDRYNYARYRVCGILAAHRGRRLSPGAARDLLRWGRRVLEARATIIQLNVPLVLSMAKRSRIHNLDFNELVSEGNLALIRSVEKFDVSRGFKFSTYACRAILKSFSRVAMKAGRYRGLFPVELNCDLEKSDLLERKRVVVEEDCVEELKHILQANLAQLNDIEQTVIRERFAIGALGPETKTLEQVGRLIGVTKERVRQIQNRALHKIKLILEDQILAA